MSHYSSRRAAIGALAVTASSARSFLLELANLRDEPEAGRRFRLKFVGLWPLPGPSLHGRLISENISRAPGSRPVDEQIDEMLDKMWILPLRAALRIVWTAPDLRTKQWGIFRILDDVVVKENQSLPYSWPSWDLPGRVTCVPTPTPFELALRYLLRRTGLCANPGCAAPYFFPTRRGQKYCSDSCAVPAQQEFKRKWWAEHGNAWRMKRKKRKERKRR